MTNWTDPGDVIIEVGVAEALVAPIAVLIHIVFKLHGTETARELPRYQKIGLRRSKSLLRLHVSVAQVDGAKSALVDEQVGT